MGRERLTGKAATQERILVAARKLFLGKGYESTTVAEIADAAEVSRATVFWHFNDKASLFRETFTRLLAPFRESLDRNLEEVDAEKRLYELVAIYESFSTDQLAEIGGFVRWAVETPTFRSLLVTTLLDLHQRFIGSLSQAIAEIVAPSEDPRILATGLMSLLDGNLLLSLFDDTPSIMETRRASVQAFVAFIPLRNRGT